MRSAVQCGRGARRVRAGADHACARSGSRPRAACPIEALDAILGQVQASRSDIVRAGCAEDAHSSAPWPMTRFEHHEAHACASYLTSPFTSATILICDHEQPGVSVWKGEGAEVRRVDWPWSGPSFSDLYSECCAADRFRRPSSEISGSKRWPG